MKKTIYLKTPIATAQLTGSKNGVSGIKIIDNQSSFKDDIDIPECLLQARLQLSEYFKKERTKFSFSINPEGTEFQQIVWKELLNIDYGKTCSYLELSKKIGNPKAIRAVASANGKNPLWIVIPCHRVIGSDGSLTGYAGGLSRKKWLLELESPSQQQLLF